FETSDTPIFIAIWGMFVLDNLEALVGVIMASQALFTINRPTNRTKNTLLCKIILINVSIYH
ncbi:hypothetical protein, partial [Salinivibrio sp. IB282]|uniref:hypothetical protein n=1 Tax=Salinivibrio sp. IB282 TaxID=1766122 RepID=UPI0009CE31D7